MTLCFLVERCEQWKQICSCLGSYEELITLHPLLSTWGLWSVLDENLCFHQPVAPKVQSLNWKSPGSHIASVAVKSNISTITICAGLANPQQARLWWRLRVERCVGTWHQHGRWCVTKRVFLMSSAIKDCDMSCYINVFLVRCLFLFSSCPSFQKYEGLKTRWHPFSWQNTKPLEPDPSKSLPKLSQQNSSLGA